MQEQPCNIEDDKNKLGKQINAIGFCLIGSFILQIITAIIYVRFKDIYIFNFRYMLFILSSIIGVIPFKILQNNQNKEFVKFEKINIQNIFLTFSVMMFFQLVIGVIVKVLDIYYFNGYISSHSIVISSAGLHGLDLMFFYLYIVLIGPVIEEYIFRGVIFSCLKEYGQWFAVVVSAVLFSLSHMNLSQMPAAVAVGLMLGFVRAKSKTIIPSTILHISNNIFALLILKENIQNFNNYQEIGLYIDITYLILSLIGVITLIVGLIKNREKFFLKEDVPYKLSSKCVDFFVSPAIIIYILIVISMVVRH